MSNPTKVVWTSAVEMGMNSVPAFLTKLWKLVDDSNTDHLIAWDASGQSFHVYDQATFAKEVLPLYFKHNNISSFIRQLNMYGFRKVVGPENGAMKSEKDDLEFQHPYFQKGQEYMLDLIKRKVSTHHHSLVKNDPGIKVNEDDVSRVLSEVQSMKGKQENVTSRLDSLKKENEALWREVASLRQKHTKQQQVVNKLIQFLVHLVGANRSLSTMKRKMPLMINDSSQLTMAKRPKYSKQLSVEEIKQPPPYYSVQSPEDPYSPKTSCGPVIHEITDIVDTPNLPIMQESVENYNMPSLTGLHQAGSRLSPNNSNQSETVIGGGLLPVMAGQSNTSPVPPRSKVEQMPQNVSTSTEPTLGPPATADRTVLSESLDSSDLNTLMDEKLMSLQALQPSSGGQSVELVEQVDSMQDDLEHLKDMLSSGQFSLDTNTLLSLFNTDASNQAGGNTDSILNLLDNPDKEEVSGGLPTVDQGLPVTSYYPGSIAGNELITYTAPQPLRTYDTLNTPVLNLSGDEQLEEIDPLSFLNIENKTTGLEEDVD